MDKSQIMLMQMSDITPDGVCEFIDCPDISQRYPDALALRVDGDSMSPRICDGDIVILSPSAQLRDGAAAVVQLRDQIGVTCKIVRRAENKIHLIPANEKYDPKIFDQNQVVWILPVLWRVRLP